MKIFGKGEYEGVQIKRDKHFSGFTFLFGINKFKTGGTELDFELFDDHSWIIWEVSILFWKFVIDWYRKK